MSPAEQIVRAPAAHRATAAVASPLIGYFVARLILHWTSLPAPMVYAVCLAIALVLAWRAWSARVVLDEDGLTVVNTLASTSCAHPHVRGITDAGRIESRSDDAPRATRIPAEALRQPWWSLGTGRGQYELNREQVRSWLRVPPAQRSGGAGREDAGAEAVDPGGSPDRPPSREPGSGPDRPPSREPGGSTNTPRRRPGGSPDETAG